MNEGVFDVFRADDLIRPEADADTVDRYLSALESFQCIGGMSPKDLQDLTASINVCLNSPRGFRNGLRAALTLVGQCSAEYFNGHGAKLVTVVAHQVMGKLHNLTPDVASLACRVMDRLVALSPNFPDVSKVLSSVSVKVVQSLILIGNRHPGCLYDVLACLSTLLATYPGACGSVASQVDKFLCNRISLDQARAVPVQQLAKCFAILPRLGGGGKDGVHHKESWSKYFDTTLRTLDELTAALNNQLPSKRIHDNGTSSHEVTASSSACLQLPSLPSSQGLAKVFAIQHQYSVVCRLLSSLLRCPFPQPKRFKPGAVLASVCAIFGQLPFTELAKDTSHEAKLVLTSLPDIYTSSAILMVDLINTMGMNLLPHQDLMAKTVLRTLQDLRQFSGVERPQDQSKSMADLKYWLYAWVRQMALSLGGCGSAKHVNEIVRHLVSDFLPPTESIQLAPTGVPKKRKKGKSAASFLGNNFANAVNKISMGSGANGRLAAASLRALSEILKASGPYLDMSAHQNVQAAVITSCLTVQTSSVGQPDPPFQDPVARSELYSALHSLIVGCHARYPQPLSQGLRIFQFGALHDKSARVRHTCALALAHCHSLAVPSAPSLSLDVPLTESQLASVAKEMMKVHTITLATSGIAAMPSGEKAFASTNGFQTSKDQSVPEVPSAADTNGGDELVNEAESQQDSVTPLKEADPNMLLLSGKTTNGGQRRSSSKRPEQAAAAHDEDEVTYEESRELLKSYNKFDNEPIFIPSDAVVQVKKVEAAPPPSKVQKVDSSVEENEEGEEMDINEMMSCFDDKLKES